MPEREICNPGEEQQRYMRDYHLIVPADCVASSDERENEHALAHMARVLKADIGSSAELNLEELNDRKQPS